MTIKFVCSCGKHLRARDDMAARRSVCPRCGAPVGIPALRPGPTDDDAGPLRAAPPPERPPTPAPRPVDDRLVRLLSRRAKPRTDRAGRHLEKGWSGCLLYPLRAWPFCLGLALLGTALTAAVALALPGLLVEPPDDLPLTLAAYRVACVLLLLLIVGLPCSFLECVLASASAGETSYLRWSGDPLLDVLFSGAKWLGCFLAGPAVFAAVGWLYQLNCGDPGWLDWLILAELAVAAGACWIYVLLSVTERGLRGFNPLAVADLAHRLGWGGLAAVLAAAALLPAHGAVLLLAAAEVHAASAWGWLLLAGGWLSGVFWATFFCRLLGVRCFRTRPAPTRAQTAPGTLTPPPQEGP
jgi:hypothetical protein